MNFEFDPEKSVRNRLKHGIDFEEVQALWDDPYVLEIPARRTEEPRYLVIGMLGNETWSTVIAYRGENIRIISARRARREELEWYESHGV